MTKQNSFAGGKRRLGAKLTTTSKRRHKLHRRTEADNNKVVFLQPSQIPPYLLASEFSESLDREDEEDSPLSIPQKAMKSNPDITSAADIDHYLQTVQYWGLSDYVNASLCTFVLSRMTVEAAYAAFEPYLANLPDLQYILEVHRAAMAGEGRMCKALLSGLAGLVRAVLSLGDPLPSNACLLAVARNCGSCECLRIVHAKGAKLEESVTAVAAAYAGNIACLRYVYSHCKRLGAEVNVAAAEHGQLECPRYAQNELECPWSAKVCIAAARGGHLDCLKYAHEHGCPWDESTCIAAAEGGHVSCLQYAHENGCLWTGRVCSRAAWSGRIDCLQYAHSHGCPLSPDVLEAAAATGSVHCMAYAREQGCPWDSGVCLAAMLSGSVPCLQYAHEHGCPWDEHTMAVAAKYGRLQCMQFAHEHGCSWGSDTVMVASEHGRLTCMLYAQAHGCALSNAEWGGDVKSGHPDCAACLARWTQYKCAETGVNAMGAVDMSAVAGGSAVAFAPVPMEQKEGGVVPTLLLLEEEGFARSLQQSITQILRSSAQLLCRCMSQQHVQHRGWGQDVEM